MKLLLEDHPLDKDLDYHRKPDVVPVRYLWAREDRLADNEM